MAKKETASPAIPVFPMLKTVEQIRPLHAGTGKSPYAARRGYRLGNARYLRWALRYAPF